MEDPEKIFRRAVDEMHRKMVVNIDSNYYNEFYSTFIEETTREKLKYKLPSEVQASHKPICDYFLSLCLTWHPNILIFFTGGITHWRMDRKDLLMAVYLIIKGRTTLSYDIVRSKLIPPETKTFINSACDKTIADPIKRINPKVWSMIDNELLKKEYLFFHPNYRDTITTEGVLFVHAFEFLYPKEAKYVKNYILEVKLSN